MRGVTGYSDLAVGPDKTIYCIYEEGAIIGDEEPTTAAL